MAGAEVFTTLVFSTHLFLFRQEPVVSLEGLGYAGVYDLVDDPGYGFLLGSYFLPGDAALFYFLFRSRMWSSCMMSSTLIRALFSCMRGYLVELAGGDRDGCNDDRGRDGWPVLRAALLRWAASSPLGLLQGLMCAGAGNAAESFSRSASTFLALLMDVEDPFNVLYCVSEPTGILAADFASVRYCSCFMHVIRSNLGQTTEMYFN